MDGMSGLVSWTDTQWKRVRQAVTEEANRVRVASSFLPTYGPLPPSTQVVPSEVVNEDALKVDDAATTRILELWVDIELSQQQLAEEDLSSAILLFRRAANLVARAEDWTIFSGRPREYGDHKTPDLGKQLRVRGGLQVKQGAEGDSAGKREVDEADPGTSGLLAAAHHKRQPVPLTGDNLLAEIVAAITALEQEGHLAPFFCILSNGAFQEAQRPVPGSLVLPSDRITPFLGHTLLRTSTIPDWQGLVVSLAGDPVDLAVASDLTPQVLNVNDEGRYRFRVFERFVLRVKERRALARLNFTAPPTPEHHAL